MRKIKLIIGRIIYDVFAKWLPVSYQILGGGAKFARKICGKLILEKCGKNVNIERGATFSSETSIGGHAAIGECVLLSVTVCLGDYVMMGPHVTMYSKNHAHDRLDIPMNEQGYQEDRPIIIGDDVWIGRDVMIIGSKEIKKGTIVGARCLLTKSFPEYSVIGGNPSRLLKSRK